MVLLARGSSSAASTGSTFWPSRTKSWPCTITGAPSASPDTHIVACSSSTIVTGTKSTMPSSLTMRTPRSPADEKVSAERGTRADATGVSGSTTSAVMPSGMALSAFGNSTSTR